MKASRHRAAEEEEAEEPPQNSKKRSKNPGENPKKLKNQNRENPKMPKQEKAVPTVKTSGASVEGPRLVCRRRPLDIASGRRDMLLMRISSSSRLRILGIRIWTQIRPRRG